MGRGTDTMERFDGVRARAPTPGLVLLAAKDAARVPPAIPLRGDALVLGREPREGVCAIPLSSVSRLHARLRRDEGGWRVEDLHSKNGTYLFGRAVEEPALLDDGAELRVGDSLFKFVADGIERYLAFGAGPPGTDEAESAVPELVGGARIGAVAEEIARAATTALPVLLLGETGTGKELAARAVHRLSGRAGAFIAINCAAVPRQLFESELFGHRRGAFTGADRDKPGLLAAAAGGTVLLDEVGELSLEAQAKLLRALEAREITPLGAPRPESIDVRIVAATHRDLPALAADQAFRPDLHARLATLTITLPPLRERKEDLSQLVRHFLREAGRPELVPSFAFMMALADYDWPQNVRECRAIVQRAAMRATGAELGASDLPDALQARVASYGSRNADRAKAAPASEARGVPPVEDLRRLLTEHHGNVAAVARALARDRAQVHRWIQRHALDPEQFRHRK